LFTLNIDWSVLSVDRAKYLAVRSFHIDAIDAGDIYPLLNKEIAQSFIACWGQIVERFITDLWGLRFVFMIYGFVGQGALSVSSTGPVTFAIKICCLQFEAVSQSLLFYIMMYRGLVSLASPEPELIP